MQISIMHELNATAKRLWYTSAYWKYSVLGAGLFTVLFVIHLFDGPLAGSGPVDPVRYAPPPPMSSAAPSDPASDVRLADYQAAHDEALKKPKIGERCENMVAALDLLTPDDTRRGRNPRASSPTLFKAIADGESCRGNLTVSNRHFDVLSGATAAAQSTHTPATIATAIAALHGLDGFDISRARYQDVSATVLTAQGFEKEEAASAARIAALSQSVAAYQKDHAAASARAAAEATDRLSSYDKDKLSGSQLALLQAGTEASRLIREGEARLGRVVRLLASVQANSTPAARRTLIDAVTALTTPFDETLASPQEAKAIARARSIAGTELWDIARQRLQELDRNPTPENYKNVAGLQAALGALSASADGDEQSILARVEAAANKLAQSDNNLTGLVAAAASWKKDGLSAAASVERAAAPIDKFDRSRFHQAEADAWKTVQDAENIIHGPDVGLNPKTKSSTTIAVLPAGQDRFDPDVARALGTQLGLLGFHVVPDKRVAALFALVSVSSRPPPQQDWTSSVEVQTAAEAQVSAEFSWQYGNIPLLPCQVTGHYRGKDDPDPTLAALRDAVRKAAACLNDYTATQPSP
jgi:hypothetical protein